MNTKLMITAIGDELKSGFFLALQEEFNVDHQKICEIWDQYYEITSDDNDDNKEKKKEKKEEKKKVSGVKKTIPQGKTSAILRSEQTPVQFSAIDKLKVAELKNLNKERGLPISGNKAILTDALKNYEKAQGVDNDDDEVIAAQSDAEELIVEEEDKKKKKASSTKKKNEEEAKITIEKIKKKKNEKQPPPVVDLIKPEELKSHTDEYGHIIVADNLVCEENDDGTLIVVAYKLVEDKDDAVYALDSEHMEKCKELNLEFRIDEFEP
ncbi:MAG: SAP domain-containing protein [Cetobacterium sp.]